MKRAVDLYSGIGGWTLGMKLSGVKNVASFEWWNEANNTHNLNFKTNHKEVNIREIEPSRDLIYDKNIDFVVGSPPCTQFSFANKGGNGDIADGLVDIYKFLEVVAFLKPKYWAMENVPRVAGILERELNGGTLSQFKGLVTTIKVVDSAEYGVPQNRKRMIAGNFPADLFEGYKQRIAPVHLHDVIGALSTEEVVDSNYGYQIPRKEVTELENEADLTPQELRINRDAKSYHPVYNNMHFPDRLDRPSRTVTATCTRVSRESIIVESSTGYRRLTVRERGVVQGFPITYQFYGRTLNAKFKLIGNAVPPILTYYLFQSMLEVPVSKVKPPSKSKYFHERPPYDAYKSKLGLPARRFPANRKFKFAVPNLRYGSGVRFELSNNPKSDDKEWSFKFFYGNSKDIKEVVLDAGLKADLAPVVNTYKNEIINEAVDELCDKYKDVNSRVFQEKWTSMDDGIFAFEFLDDVGRKAAELLEKMDLDFNDLEVVSNILGGRSKKIEEHKRSMLLGFYYLSILNKKIFTL